MKKVLTDAFFYLLFALIGIWIGTALVDYNVIDKVRFWWRPVVQMQGILIGEISPGHITIHMYGKKLRGVECEYRGIQAYGDRITGLPVDLNSRRLDIPEKGDTKDEGTYDIGFWEIWPTEGIYRIRVNVGHLCGKSRVSTEIASINLDERNSK